MNDDNKRNLDDASERFALLELDYVGAPVGYATPPTVAPAINATRKRRYSDSVSAMHKAMTGAVWALSAEDTALRVDGLFYDMARLPRATKPFQPDPFEASTAIGLAGALYYAARCPQHTHKPYPETWLQLARCLWVCNRATARAIDALSWGLAVFARAPRKPAPQFASLESLAAHEAAGKGAELVAEGEGTHRGYGWGGEGRLPWQTLSELAETYAVRQPTTKDAGAYFGDACHAENSSHYVVRKMRGGGQAHYRIARATTEISVGGSLADNVAVIWLTADNQVCASPDSDQAIVARVRQRFTESMSQLIMKPADVTAWLNDVFERDFGAARYYAGWHVTDSACFARADGLCHALKELGWGRLDRWGIGIHLSTCSGILDSIADNYSHRVEQLARHFASQTKAAHERGNAAIGARMATTIMGDLRDVIESVKAYAKIIGPTRVESVYHRARKLLAQIDPLVSDTAQRGALLELE